MVTENVKEFGRIVNIKIENCNGCGGVGFKKGVENININIPKGTLSGSKMVVSSAGNDANGGERGDVYLKIGKAKTETCSSDLDWDNPFWREVEDTLIQTVTNPPTQL